MPRLQIGSKFSYKKRSVHFCWDQGWWHKLVHSLCLAILITFVLHRSLQEAVQQVLNGKIAALKPDVATLQVISPLKCNPIDSSTPAVEHNYWSPFSQCRNISSAHTITNIEVFYILIESTWGQVQGACQSKEVCWIILPALLHSSSRLRNAWPPPACLSMNYPCIIPLWIHWDHEAAKTHIVDPWDLYTKISPPNTLWSSLWLQTWIPRSKMARQEDHHSFCSWCSICKLSLQGFKEFPCFWHCICLIPRIFLKKLCTLL